MGAFKRLGVFIIFVLASSCTLGVNANKVSRESGKDVDTADPTAPVQRFDHFDLEIDLPEFGYVNDRLFSPDGNHLVFSAHYEFAPFGMIRPQLFVSSKEGPEIRTRLLGKNLTASGAHSIPQFFTSDSKRVVYSLTRGLSADLYAIDLDGGNQVRLTKDLNVATGAKLTSGSDRIVFRAFNAGPSVTYDLYSVRLDGSDLVRLSGSEVLGVGVSDFQISNNGSRVVYETSIRNISNPNPQQIFSVTPAGNGRVPLTPALPLNQYVIDFEVSPNSSLIWYLAQQEAVGPAELYTTGITGGGIIKLHPDLTSFSQNIFQVQFTPDSQKVVFRGDIFTDRLNELFSTNVDGSSLLNLSSNPNMSVSRFEISPVSNEILYQIGPIGTSSNQELHVIRADGSAGTLITSPSGSCGSARSGSFYPDGTRVMFSSSVNGMDYLCSISSGGAALQILLPQGNSRYRVREFELSPDSTKVMFEGADLNVAGTHIYTMGVDGSGLRPISRPSENPPNDPLWSPSSSGIVYDTRGPAPIRLEKIYWNNDPTSPSIVLNPPMRGFNQMPLPYVTSDEKTLVFHTDFFGTNNQPELYTMEINNPNTFMKINSELLSTTRVRNYKLLAEETRIIYQANEEARYDESLYISKLDGREKIKLNGALPQGGNVRRWHVVEEKNKVLYMADEQMVSINHIYSVNLDGTGRSQISPPNRLESIINFELYGEKIVYIKRLNGSFNFQLFAMNIDGTEHRQLTNYPESTLISTYKGTEDGNWILFRADADVDGKFELYRIKTDGTGLSKVNAPIADGEDVVQFYVNGDGSRIIYDTRGAGNLLTFYKTNLSGSLRPSVLTLSPSSFFLGGDLSYLFYREGSELKSIRFDDSAMFTISPPLSEGEQVVFPTYDLARGRVVFGIQDESQMKLYVANSDGSKRVRVDGGLSDGATVGADYQIAKATGHVYFRKNSAEGQPLDLYRASLEETAGNTTLVVPEQVNGERRSEQEGIGQFLTTNAGLVIYSWSPEMAEPFRIFGAMAR